MSLKRKELETRVVPLDGVNYTVTAMTVHKRTMFEAAMVRRGATDIREAMLIFCVSVGGFPVFNPDAYIEEVKESPGFKDRCAVQGVDADAIAEEMALDRLFDYVADYPGTQVEPLVTAALAVNGQLGNDSSPN